MSRKILAVNKIFKMTIPKKISLNITFHLFILLGIFFYIIYYLVSTDFSVFFESIPEMKDKYLTIFIVSIFLIIVVIYFVSYFVSNRISKQIRKITNITKNMKERNGNEKITANSTEEIKNLADALNDLIGRIEKETKNVEKLENIRSEFLGNVSHELRTPIFSIQGYIETLLGGAIHDSTVNIDFLKKIQKHSDRLNNLLNDLIEISRMESKEIKMSFRFFEIQDFITLVIEEMKPKANQKNLNLVFQPLDIKSLVVYADRDRIRQVLVNLIDNAIKYNKENGSVVVNVINEKDFVKISVKDTGIGIPQDDLPRIFERFYRVDKNRSREMGGTGLGLAIAKHIIEAHKGELSVESKLGEGSIFKFRLSKNAV
jgi:two-component system, OmpR family, phosphate regulon sensor histidine kinase PhoR